MSLQFLQLGWQWTLMYSLMGVVGSLDRSVFLLLYLEFVVSVAHVVWCVSQDAHCTH